MLSWLASITWASPPTFTGLQGPEAPEFWENGCRHEARVRGFGGLFVEALRLDLWPADEVRRRALRALELEVAGFLLFGGGTVEEVSRLTGWLREAASEPLLFCADMERGAGQQVLGATQLPPPAALALHADAEEVVEAAARITAGEARGMGFNWVLAPVLDLDIEPRNPIVGTRSFGGDPERVARLGQIWVDACQAEGVAACAKHFPGHGRTTQDSHVELPSVGLSRAALEEDLLPFRRVAPQVAAVMTAHVAYPALGARGPATLCKDVLCGLLRADLGFQGVIVTDALVMQGVRPNEGKDDARGEGRLAARAVAAGCDLLLYPLDLSGAVHGLSVAASRDPSVAARATEALCRVQSMRRTYKTLEGRGPWPGDSERVALRLALESLWAPEAPPELTREKPTEILWFGCETHEPSATTPSDTTFATELSTMGWQVVSVKPLSPAAVGRKWEGSHPTGVREGGEEKQRILVICWSPRAGRGRAKLPAEVIRAIREVLSGGTTWVIVFGHLRILTQIGAPGLCAWSDEPLMQRAAARWLDERVKL